MGSTMTARRRILWRFGFAVAALALWIAVLATALEAYGSWCERRAHAAAETFESRMWPDVLRRNEAAALRLIGHEPNIGTDIAARDAFATLDEVGRRRFVEDRAEFVVLCGRQGEVLEKHEAPLPSPLDAVAARIEVGRPVTACLAAAQAEDALRTIASIRPDSPHESREYEIALDERTDYVTQWTFRDAGDIRADSGAVAVFIRASMWKVLWLSFRENVYQNDAYEFRSNNLGFRDDDITLPRPADIVRIACVGGSTTAEGLTNALTYPNILEKKLRARLNTDRVEVVNCGVFALRSAGERERMPDFLAIQPDLIVHYNFVNDLADNLPSWLEDDAKTSMAGRLRAWSRHSRFFFYRVNRWLLPPDEDIARRIEEKTLANMRDMVSQARGAGVDFAICSFAAPDVGSLSEEERAFYDWRATTMHWGRLVDIASYARIIGLYNTAVDRLCAEEGLPYVPVAEGIRGGADCFSDVCHMHLDTIERKAEIIAESIEPYVRSKLGRAESHGAAS